MKYLTTLALLLSLSAFARPGVEKSLKNGASINGPATLGTVTDVEQATSMQSSNTDPSTEGGNQNLERGNTSANPIPDDTTLRGDIKRGPYKDEDNKESQEATEEEIDYRAVPKNQ